MYVDLGTTSGISSLDERVKGNEDLDWLKIRPTENKMTNRQTPAALRFLG